MLAQRLLDYEVHRLEDPGVWSLNNNIHKQRLRVPRLSRTTQNGCVSLKFSKMCILKYALNAANVDLEFSTSIIKAFTQFSQCIL